MTTDLLFALQDCIGLLVSSVEDQLDLQFR